jgi:hypothetical protein
MPASGPSPAPKSANGNNNSNGAKRSIDDAWQGDETTQPRQDGAKSGPSTARNSNSFGPPSATESGLLSAASKKSMMDGLGGPTEYQPSFNAVHGSFQSSTPLNFGSSVPPMMQQTSHFPMMPSGLALFEIPPRPIAPGYPIA